MRAKFCGNVIFVVSHGSTNFDPTSALKQSAISCHLSVTALYAMPLGMFYSRAAKASIGYIDQYRGLVVRNFNENKNL